MDVEWNKPLNTPIPLPMDSRYKLSNPRITEYSNIKIATRLNNIDFSRLKVTATAHNNNITTIRGIYSFISYALQDLNPRMLKNANFTVWENKVKVKGKGKCKGKGKGKGKGKEGEGK